MLVLQVKNMAQIGTKKHGRSSSSDVTDGNNVDSYSRCIKDVLQEDNGGGGSIWDSDVHISLPNSMEHSFVRWDMK